MQGPPSGASKTNKVGIPNFGFVAWGMRGKSTLCSVDLLVLSRGCSTPVLRTRDTSPHHDAEVSMKPKARTGDWARQTL